MVNILDIAKEKDLKAFNLNVMDLNDNESLIQITFLSKDKQKTEAFLKTLTEKKVEKTNDQKKKCYNRKA